MAKIKLSDAIRQGGEIRSKANGKLFEQKKDGTVCSCALGGAYEAVKGAVPSSVAFTKTGNLKPNFHHAFMQTLREEFPQLKEYVQNPRGEEGSRVTLEEAVIVMNDGKDHARWFIADWVAQQGY